MTLVRYLDSNGKLIHETKTDDLSGLILAIEKSEDLAFGYNIYTLDRFRLNYAAWGKSFVPELHVYLILK
jgi:hypothetical protein